MSLALITSDKSLGIINKVDISHKDNSTEVKIYTSTNIITLFLIHKLDEEEIMYIHNSLLVYKDKKLIGILP